MREIVASGVNVHEATASGWTPLHAAAEGGHAEVVHYLLLHGANRYARDRTGETPFSVATRSSGFMV